MQFFFTETSIFIRYLVAEIVELAGNAAKEQKKNRIHPRHIQLAIKQDDELNNLLGRTTIMAGGVLPSIHPALIKKAKGSASQGI